MKIGIMQPYFAPYIGYFQLIRNVDLLIIYDNIKYTKKGWINRNRILRNGADVTITLPLRKDSDSCDVVERQLASDFSPRKLLAQISNAYRLAPHFSTVLPLLESILLFEDHNLFRFNHNSLRAFCDYLGLLTPIQVSSTFPIDHDLTAEDKVLALCRSAGADAYINPIGGLSLYSRARFQEHGIELRFLRSSPFEYDQFGAPFVPWLSIIDVMMFNPVETIAAQLERGWRYE